MYKNFKRMVNKKDKSSSRKRNPKTSTLTSKRLTVPPGFLLHGIVSDTAAKNIGKRECIDDKENKYILKEDLHSLFNQFETSCDVQNQRRSVRIQKKNFDENVNNAFSAADYNNILVENPEDMNESSAIQGSTLKDTSKSIFKEINRKYAGVGKAKKLGCSGLTHREEHVKGQTMSNAFSGILKEELLVNIREDNLKLCKAAIKKKIEMINDILVGRKNPSKPITVEAATEMKDSLKENNNILPGFNLIPSSQWVYETPPGRKLQTSNIPKPTNIQPAFICKQQNHINIYELEPNALLNLRSTEEPFGDIQKTFILENNFQDNNIFEDFSLSHHKNFHDKRFNFARPSTQTKPTVRISPPPKMAKWSSNVGAAVFSEPDISHHKDMLIGNNGEHSFEDIADDMTIIEDNGNYHMTTSQNIQRSFDFHGQRFGGPPFLFNNNQLENGYTTYKGPL
nr:unnamed protein product [Callosobruchus analis]